jgi:hypothetical protein
MLGLRQKISRDPVRVAAAVGKHQHLGRPGNHINTNLAEHEALRRRHIGIAGTDDLRDRCDGLGAVRERGDRLRTADAVDLVDAGELRGREHQRRELAVGCRHHHHDARHARDLGRHRIHQHRRRIGRSAAGHIEADRLDRGPAMAKLDPERVDETVVFRKLSFVKGLDPIARKRQCIERARLAGRSRGRDLLGLHPQPDALEIDTVEPAGELDQRAIAARRDICDDRAHRIFHIGRGLPLGGEKCAEARVEVGRADIKADRHGCTIARIERSEIRES